MDPSKFKLDKYDANSSRCCVLEVHLAYPKELQTLHNSYTLASDKLEIKKEMLFDYPLEIADSYNISIGNVKNLDKEKTSLTKKRTRFSTELFNFI